MCIYVHPIFIDAKFESFNTFRGKGVKSCQRPLNQAMGSPPQVCLLIGSMKDNLSHSFVPTNHKYKMSQLGIAHHI